MSTAIIPRKDTDEARAELREIFPPGSEARTILRHVSSSGMTRWISVIGPDFDNLSWLVAAALGEKVHERNGTFCLKVTGCGMDMGFSLIEGLSRTLYRDGYECTNTGATDPEHGWKLNPCPSNQHVNDRHTYGEHVDEPHRDGYAVSQRWL